MDLDKREVYLGIFILVVIISVFLGLKGDEDFWIKNKSGEYAKDIAPSGISDYVSEQQRIILEARELYIKNRNGGMKFSSQCLGVVGGNVKYAVDIVHVPRTSKDDNPENQCEDYRNGNVKHFIELDDKGNIVRII